MKKFLLVSIVALSTLLVASLIILAYFVIQNNKKAREETSQRQNLKTFESRLYKFRFDYPDTLFLQSGENASLLPGNIKLANFENKENQPEDAVFYEIKVIDDNETKVLKKTADYAQIAEMTKNKYKSEDITLGSKEAVKLTNSEKIKENVVSIFCLWEKKIYRIDFLPQTVSTYEKNRDGLSTILSSFAFLSDADFVSAFQNRALAASSCDSIDQQYAPETKIYTEPLGTAAVDGQTFMPTKTSICKIAIDLEDVTSSQTGTIWLYTEGGQELARKTQNISDGWNTFVLDATVTVTPEAVYKIMFNINGDTGPKWRAGETDISDGYSRGHAITNNHDETDLDFHFKEYYLTGSDTNQNVNQNKNQNANTSTKKRHIQHQLITRNKQRGSQTTL